MTPAEQRDLLQAVADHRLDVAAADQQLTAAQQPLDFANLDLERPQRTGYPETVFGEGKTAEQISRIIPRLRAQTPVVLCTRVTAAKAQAVQQRLADRQDVRYVAAARCLVVGEIPTPTTTGTIAIVTAGTSDIPVAEEAAVTAQAFGNRISRVYDVGVAGIHRLFAKLDVIRQAKVVIVAAGMDGALASVVGGLVASPVIALPTSIGYGSSYHGLSALLTMLNSCAEGVTVVNIDNGFGAAYAASVMNHL
ncbi:nickel pincer cofactor biosynthesis protein LarB [Levilactobacillus zymae]|uniref:Circadian phase modifier n=1 Tax=Levilactobacillus zymae TaxID=267363 RepID=A0A1Y6K038_9LACO|nr:nickel pincer cofactor biosynthesis protein LarB [Levilactobacillus zymae]SMS14712.1 Circadian phase modifier [Levilactobacillus zymae]